MPISQNDSYLNSQILHEQLRQISMSNKKLLQNLGSQLILQSPYIDDFLRSTHLNNAASYQFSQLQKRYNDLMDLKDQSLNQKGILKNQLQMKRQKLEDLNEQISNIEALTEQIEREIQQMQIDSIQQEQLEAKYQDELIRRNCQLTKEIEDSQFQQHQLVKQCSVLRQQIQDFQKMLQNERQQLKQQQYLCAKKQEQQKEELTQLTQMKKQMLKKRQKLLKNSCVVNLQRQKQSSKTTVLKQINEIQQLISSFKKNKKMHQSK